MPRIEDQQKQEIKQQDLWLKLQQNQGIRTADISGQLIWIAAESIIYLVELPRRGKITQKGWGWESLEFSGVRLYRFELSPEEVVTLYLGARLLVKQHDSRNEPAETALRKLATVLRSDAPIGKEIERAADELAQRDDDIQYQSIFRTVAQAYAFRKQIDLVYAPLGQKSFSTRFAIYLIEPSLVAQQLILSDIAALWMMCAEVQAGAYSIRQPDSGGLCDSAQISRSGGDAPGLVGNRRGSKNRGCAAF